MKYPEYKYFEVAYNGIANRNQIVEIGKVPKPEGKDCYRTYFRYPEEFKNHIQKYTTVSGYKGSCYADFLPLDIDNEDLNLAYQHTSVLIKTLEVDYDYYVTHLFFSGRKGFHLLIPINCFGDVKPSNNLHEIFKKIVVDLADDIPSVDTSIYDKTRLFRLGNTQHSKSNLYKIPLTLGQFNSGLAIILELAKQPQKSVFPDLEDSIKEKFLAQIYNNHKNGSLIVSSKTQLDDIVTAEVGERNTKAIKFAGLLRNFGMGEELFRTMMQMWNKQLAKPLPDNELDTVCKSSSRWAKEDEYEQKIYRLEDVAKEYEEYLKDGKQVSVGIKAIDEAIRGLRVGQVLTILGFTGNFKSALLQWILRNHTKTTEEAVLLFELEMSRLDLFERGVQMSTNLSGSEIETYFKDGNDEQRNDLLGYLKEDFSNFYVCDIPNITLEQMYEFAEFVENSTGKKIGLIGVDFMQLIDGTGSSNVERMDRVAKELKWFARGLNCPVIAISQITAIDNEYRSFGLMSARDSKTIGQMGDYVIGIHLKSEQEPDVQVITVLKNRKGMKGSAKMQINRKSLRFQEL